MTSGECTLVMAALDKKNLGDMAGFRVDVLHDFESETEQFEGYWEVVLIPLIHRIYLLNMITTLVCDCDIHVAIYTDVYRPGCIIIH